jgi:hypothetical protein
VGQERNSWTIIAVVLGVQSLSRTNPASFLVSLFFDGAARTSCRHAAADVQ